MKFVATIRDNMRQGLRHGCCSRMSFLLYDLFGWAVIAGEYERPGHVCGWMHVWNRLPDGRIFDATADQFGETAMVFAGDDARYTSW